MSTSAESPIDEIKQRLSIKDVVSSYVKLEKAGQNYRARCPFHNERTPSFFVSPDRGSFHCFGCGKGGDIFTFVEEIENVEFKEALKLLAEKAGVTLSSQFSGQNLSQGRLRETMNQTVSYYQSEFAKSEVAKKYIKERGIDGAMIESFKIGFAPAGWRNLAMHLRAKGYSEIDAEKAGLLVKSDKGYYDRFRGRLMFPFFDYSGRPIGFSARVLPGATDDNQGKYINSPETLLFHKSRVFYGLNQAKNSIRERDKTILVEGQIDVIMAHQIGTTNCVGVSGTALTPLHLDILTRLSNNLTILLDADEAGFRASEKAVRLALSRDMFVSAITLPEGEDPASLIQKNPELWRNTLEKEKPFTDFALEMISARMGESGKDSRKIQEALHTYLYPHLSDMYNEIEKDKVMQKISQVLGVSLEAAKSDYDKWRKSGGSAQDQREDSSRSRGEQKDARISSSVIMVGRRLLGIAALYKSRKNPEESKILEKKLSDLLDVSMISDDIESLLFEAELYYPISFNLEEETKTLLSRLSQEVYKAEFAEAMEKLRRAEINGDEDEIRDCLNKCQEISKKLTPQSK